MRDHYRRDIKIEAVCSVARHRQAERRAGEAVAARTPSRQERRRRPLPSAHGFAITIILALAHHPSLLDHFAEEVAHLDIRQKQLAELLGLLTETIFRNHGIDARAPRRRCMRGSSHGKLFDTLGRSSAFKRVAFLQPEIPQAEVEEQFAELIYRWTTLQEPRQGGAGPGARSLADLSEAEFEHFAQLQQQVANAGLRHAADDAGDRDSAKRFQETIARLKGENIGGQRGRRLDRRPDQR